MAKRKEAEQAVQNDISKRKIQHVDEYKKHFSKQQKTYPVATRLTKSEIEKLKSIAIAENKRISEIVKEWILEKLINY